MRGGGRMVEDAGGREGSIFQFSLLPGIWCRTPLTSRIEGIAHLTWLDSREDGEIHQIICSYNPWAGEERRTEMLAGR